MEWPVKEYGMSQRNAYLQMSVNPGVRGHVYQMIPDMSILYTAGVEFPKECIRGLCASGMIILFALNPKN
jgi:hypothetical protein